MGALSPIHVVLILLIALVIIGPGKLPETGAALGRAIRGFREALEGRDEPAGTPSEPKVGPGEDERTER